MVWKLTFKMSGFRMNPVLEWSDFGSLLYSHLQCTSCTEIWVKINIWTKLDHKYPNKLRLPVCRCRVTSSPRQSCREKLLNRSHSCRSFLMTSLQQSIPKTSNSVEEHCRQNFSKAEDPEEKCTTNCKIHEHANPVIRVHQYQDKVFKVLRP